MTQARGGSPVYEPRDPAHHWPVRWKDADPKSERRLEVILSCSCSTTFAEPVPPVGSRLWCRFHGAALVLVVAAEEEVIQASTCAGETLSGHPCKHGPTAGSAYCANHRP